MNRRELIRNLSVLLAAPVMARALPTPEPSSRVSRSLAILILGGTGFLGPWQVRHALERGHRVTLFNRGRSDAVPPGAAVETLLGDRDSRVGRGLEALHGTRRWDVVIDNSGYVPRHVRDSVALLADRCERYVYVSTVSVYDDPARAGAVAEDSPLRPAPAPSTEEVTGATYGSLKAECDRLVRARMGERAVVVRPAYIVGPGDPTDRFTWWVERAARGGDALGPPDPDMSLQWVDVRDLAPWTVDLAELPGGIFNAAGPPQSWRRVLEEIAASVASKPVNWRWATHDVLRRTGVDLPLVPPGGGRGLIFEGSRAQRAGLAYRPVADTAQATLHWWRSQDPERRSAARDWPSDDRERAALALLATASAPT